MKHKATHEGFYKGLGLVGSALLAISMAGIILLGWGFFPMLAGLAMMGVSIYKLDKIEKRNRAKYAEFYKLAEMYGAN